ncbi:MAG TPA: peptide chain release factor N(5)-glutamine methyltransferase [Planctomycetaceae bacterium]
MASPPVEKAADDGAWTVGKIIDWTTGHLKKHGSDTPRLEAEILLAHARNCPRIQLYVHYNEVLSEAERATMRDLVKRRAQAEPVAYLVGHREFFGLEFRVTPDVLVPRPETETLVLELIAASKASQRLRLLDLCTGSGCVAVAAAMNLPAASLTATDISPPALAIARENADRHGVSNRIRFLEGDLFAAVADGEKFDVVAGNPPYVADAEMETLPADVRQHEPHLALRAGSQGLDVISRLIADAKQYLSPNGVLLIEFSPEQAAAVAELIERTGAFEAPRLIKDASGRLRVLVAKLAPSR